MDPCKRIFELLATRGIEQKAFAEVLGVSENIVSTWRTGRTKSYRKYLPQIAEVLNTSVEYLLTGNTEIVVATHGVPAQETLAELLDVGEAVASNLISRIRDLLDGSPDTVKRIGSSCTMTIEAKILGPQGAPNRKPATLSSGEFSDAAAVVAMAYERATAKEQRAVCVLLSDYLEELATPRPAAARGNIDLGKEDLSAVTLTGDDPVLP